MLRLGGRSRGGMGGDVGSSAPWYSMYYCTASCTPPCNVHEALGADCVIVGSLICVYYLLARWACAGCDRLIIFCLFPLLICRSTHCVPLILLHEEYSIAHLPHIYKHGRMLSTDMLSLFYLAADGNYASKSQFSFFSDTTSSHRSTVKSENKYY